MDTVRVRYTCRLCAVRDAVVLVPARGPKEDVKTWVQETLGHAIKADHVKRSPRCTAGEANDVKIPMPAPGQRIGDALMN